MKGIIFAIFCVGQCLANVGEVRLFWVDKNDGKIESCDLDGGNRVVVKSGLDDPRGVAVDSENCKLYWAVRSPVGAIYRANFDGSDTELVIASLSDPGDIELDLENRLIYWAEEGSNKIMRAGMDTPLVEEVLSGLNRPYYLAIDEDHVYWTDFDSPVIHRATLVNRLASDFITDLGRVRDVEVFDGFIYWCDRGTSDVRRRALDEVGSGTVLFSGAGFNRPHGLALDPESGTLFWTDTADIRVGSGPMGGDGEGAAETIEDTNMSSPWAVAITRPVVLGPPRYEAWTLDNFTQEELLPENEAVIWGEDADPDGDGRSNLLEYAQGTSPKSAVLRADLMRVEVDEKVGVVIRMRVDDPLLSFDLETSADLTQGTWSSGSFQELGDGVPDPSDSSYAFMTLEADPLGERLFVRVRVSK